MEKATVQMFLGEPKPEVSLVVENYLQAIYKLGERGERVFPSRLADVLDVSAATVVGMLKRLTRQNLVRISEAKEIALTPRGRELAEGVVRRHRLAERMLTELLGVEWHHAHEEAHRFEHAISPLVEERMAKALGFPKTCPFGHPIPGYGGELNPPFSKRLDHAVPGEALVVERVPEEDARLLEFLAQSGLKPGARIAVQEVAPFKGTITVRVGDRDVVLGSSVAGTLLVRAGEVPSEDTHQ
ncbi:MAG: metal-dependent transcriptional regulator [Chloroflexi bacterium]|nr:metal-dependent transcriptional regulator [Chloroflexota bacterium]